MVAELLKSAIAASLHYPISEDKDWNEGGSQAQLMRTCYQRSKIQWGCTHELLSFLKEEILLYLAYFIYQILDTIFYLNCEAVESSPGKKWKG